MAKALEHDPKVAAFLADQGELLALAVDVAPRTAGQFEGRSQVSTWLLSIARFKALTALRQRKHEDIDQDDVMQIADHADTPEASLDRSRTSAILRSIRLLQLAICAFVATSLAISVDAVAQLHLPLLPTVLAMLGVVLMFGGTLEMWREAGLSVKSLEMLLDRSRRKLAKPPAG